MEIPVVIEPVAGNGFRASTGLPLNLNAEGATGEEALEKLRVLVDRQVANGIRVAALPIPGLPAKSPWVEFAGMFKDDPYFEEWQEAIAENRRKDEQGPDVP